MEQKPATEINEIKRSSFLSSINEIFYLVVYVNRFIWIEIKINSYFLRLTQI